MSDLSDLADVYYRCFGFSLAQLGNKSLLRIFWFEQNNTRIAVFAVRHKRSIRSGLRVDILAPTPENTINDNGFGKNTFQKQIKENKDYTFKTKLQKLYNSMLFYIYKF
jgi:transcription-repair coupling factor (superfamily II helicase)